jgi:hypothetical protein
MPTTLSEATIRLLEALRRAEERTTFQEQEGVETIHVSNITRGLGFLYERIRNVLDYKEESLWAKNAILRILKRRELQILSGEDIGLFLIQELIRGRYLENDSVPESKAIEVDRVLAKYRGIWMAAFPEGIVAEKSQRLRADWLLGIAASEIEEVLRKDWRDFLYFQFLYDSLRGRIEFPAEIDEETSRLQLYLASFRAFFQADTDMESWMLWRIAFPNWKENIGEAELAKIGKELPAIYGRFQTLLSWPFRQGLERLVKRRSVLVTFLSGILRENLAEAESILTDADKLEENLKKVYQERYNENRHRLRRSAFRAIFFILLTKVLLALAVEVPYERWAFGRVDSYTLMLNILLPPVILLVASLSIRMPGEESNFAKLLVEFNRLISPDKEILGTLKLRKPRKPLAKVSIGTLYIANFALTFGILFWIVRMLHFNLASAIIFVLFLSIVSFFALRLRQTANELVAMDDTEHWARQLFDFLIFPIVEVGRALSWGFRSLNLLVLLFDFLLEAPFHSFIAILEEWFAFLRERKESL